MRKILIAVDKTAVPKAIQSTFLQTVMPSDTVILLYVQRLEGASLMIDMLGDAELATLKDSLEGTRHKEELDREAHKALDSYLKKLGKYGNGNLRTMIRAGRPAEEILAVAREEGADLIVLGSGMNKGVDRIIAGNIVREVKKEAAVPVVTARKAVMCEEPYSWNDAYAAFSALTIVVFGMLILGFML